jgi:hypothetical protein
VRAASSRASRSASSLLMLNAMPSILERRFAFYTETIAGMRQNDVDARGGLWTTANATLTRSPSSASNRGAPHRAWHSTESTGRNGSSLLRWIMCSIGRFDNSAATLPRRLARAVSNHRQRESDGRFRRGRCAPRARVLGMETAAHHPPR